MISVAFDHVCSCLVAAYRWSIIGQAKVVASWKNRKSPVAELWSETSAGATALSLHGNFVAVGTITLSIEVPLIFDRLDSGPLCVHKAFFKAQLLAAGLHF